MVKRRNQLLMAAVALIMGNASVATGESENVSFVPIGPFPSHQKSQPSQSPASGAGSETLCSANNDCISTTFCCSSYSCVNPRTCLHGNKTELDVCDYNFECLSRCCVKGVCNHIFECYSQCESNQDCVGKTILGTRVDNPRHDLYSQVHKGCCSSNLCTEAIVCEGNKLLGDYCDHNSECLSELCDINRNQCTSHEKAMGKEVAKGYRDHDSKDRFSQDNLESHRRVQIRNLVVIACIIAFICLLAILVKCLKKQSSTDPEQLGGSSECNIRYEEIKRDFGDDQDSQERSFSLGQLLYKGTSRKHFFTGQVKRPLSPSKKYAGQASPIPEDSQEYNTGLSQKQRSQKSLYYKTDQTQSAQQSFNSLTGQLLLSQSSLSSMEERQPNVEKQIQSNQSLQISKNSSSGSITTSTATINK